jgi:hypothetical protein
MDVRFAGTERPASWLVPEIVPQLNSPTAKRTGVMGLPLPLATGLSWVGPPSNLGGVCARYVLQSMSVTLSRKFLFFNQQISKFTIKTQIWGQGQGWSLNKGPGARAGHFPSFFYF